MLQNGLTEKVAKATNNSLKAQEQKKIKKRLKVRISIILIILIILIIFIAAYIDSLKITMFNSATYISGKTSNVPYIVSSQIMDKLVIVEKDAKYTYAFKSDTGEICTLDEAMDEALASLKGSDDTYLGTTAKSKKNLLKKMIQAEIATQYPDITLSEDLNLDNKTTATSTGSGNDYCVNMADSNALPACTEEQLTQIINSSKMSQEAKNNMLPLVSDIIKYQNEYKVNAVFYISVVRKESGWGTDWAAIDSSTYNWASVKGAINGGYIDGSGTSWNKYLSFADATEKWFTLISNAEGGYFGSGLYTVQQISTIYCGTPEEWAEAVSSFIEEFYGYIDVTPAGTLSTTTANSSGGQKTGNLETTKELKQDENIQGGIKIQRKDENGNTVDLIYTSTDNFNALVSSNSEDALNYYTLVKTGGTTSSSVLGGVVLEGNDVAEQIWNFLINDMGYSEYVAAGIMGNIMEESGGQTLNIDPRAENFEGNGHYGIFQWDKVTYPDVLYKDLAVQLEFYKTWINEFDTYAKNYKSGFSYQEFLTMTDPEQVAIAFATVLERYEGFENGVWQSYVVTGSTAKYEQRMKNAKNAYATYVGNSSINSQAASSNNVLTASDSDWLTAAAEIKKYVADNGYKYGDTNPKTTKKINCASYVSWSLINYGYNCTENGVPINGAKRVGQWCKNNGFEVVYEGEPTLDTSFLQPGDIIIEGYSMENTTHTQIYAGKNSDGKHIWYNCGGDASIARQPGTDMYGDPYGPDHYIVAAYRVPGSGTSKITSLDNFLFIGDSRYEGIEPQLTALGNNITAIGVSSSWISNWMDVTKNGSGFVGRGLNSSNGETVTLPDSVSGVSILLGTNGAGNESEMIAMQQLLQNLHERYPNVPIFVNSVYHVSRSYDYANPESMNASIDKLNESIKDFCNQNSWAFYIDVTQDLDDNGGYLKSEFSDQEGLHISGENGINTLVNNIKNEILNSGANISGDEENNDSNRPGYAILVANRKQVDTTISETYAHSITYKQEIGHYPTQSRPDNNISGTNVVNSSSTITYSSTKVDYQQSLNDFTLYFDFLWTILVETEDRKLVNNWAELACDNIAENAKVIITVYNEEQVTTNTTTQPRPQYVVQKGPINNIITTDYYNVTQTTSKITTALNSKAAVTFADTWLIRYENDAETYSEFQRKSKETIYEKIDLNSDEDNIVKILRKRKTSFSSLDKNRDFVEEVLNDNEKITFMIDIFNYVIDTAKGSKNIKLQLSSLLDTSLFDLSTAESTNTTRVLLYDSINISNSERKMLYKTVEKICGTVEGNDENVQRKKYVTSVILNRVLSSKFPNSVNGVITKKYQFEGFEPSNLGQSLTISDETRDAVDYVIAAGDHAQHSVYFAKPSTATKNKWDENYKFTFNDGDKTDNSFNYYTTEEVETELKKYETVIRGNVTTASGTAQRLVDWAENQVGKTTFYNSYKQQEQDSAGYCAAFIQSAYYEAGLEYYGANAIDLPHENKIEFNDDGTVDCSEIPVGAIIVSQGTGEFGHVAVYVGNGYVIEAGGNTIVKTPIDQSNGSEGGSCAPFIGWGFATHDQNEARGKLVVTIGGNTGNYAQGWTDTGSEVGAWGQSTGTGIQGIYTAGNKSYKVYAQGCGPYQGVPYWDGTIATDGCGITSAAIILTGYGNDVDPEDVKNDNICPDGNIVSRFVTQFAKYGIESHEEIVSNEKIIANLKAGRPVLINVQEGTIGNNYYGGHWLALLGINEQGQIFLADPGSTFNSAYFDQSRILNGSIKNIVYIDS